MEKESKTMCEFCDRYHDCMYMEDLGVWVCANCYSKSPYLFPSLVTKSKGSWLSEVFSNRSENQSFFTKDSISD